MFATCDELGWAQHAENWIIPFLTKISSRECTSVIILFFGAKATAKIKK